MRDHFVNLRFLTSFLMATSIALLAGCSDNTGGAGTNSTPITPTATAVQLLVSSQQMLSSATASTSLTAVALNNGQAISGRTVIFSAGTDSAYFTNVAATTNDNGIATATLNIGSNMANRAISVSATADTAVGTSTVNVAGTKIAISGNTSLALNASSALTVIVKDSTGAPVSGVTLTVTSQNGNPVTLTPATGITDATGQVTATVTANNAGAGTDTLTVSGAGVSQPQAITINSASFAFTAPVVVPPASTPEILVNTPTSVSVRWFNGGAPVADGTAITFSTSRGTVTPSVTTIGGVATASISAASTGATILTASGPGSTPAATLNVVFVTASASSITAQASPGTVAVNTGGNTTNQSVISVVVRDASKNLVKNAHVNFSQVTDPTSGSLAASAATTDITGTASVNYIAGPTSSGQNGVQISTTVDMVNGVSVPNITTSVYLTVASQALYVRLGTDNKIYPDTPVRGAHTKEYTALVTDAAGNAAPDGTEVRFVLRPAPLAKPSFWKGQFNWVGTPVNRWVQTRAVDCVSEDANANGLLDTEDINGNGLLDTGEDANSNSLLDTEDINGNGRLDPLGVASVNATAKTVSGFATAKISYAKENAYWVQNDIEARAGTIGNDPPSVVTLELPGSSADYTSQAVSPPGDVSPFGTGNLCTDTN